MIKIIIGFVAGAIVGALVKPVASYVNKGYLWAKAWLKSKGK